jgi:hypothetical protein
MSVVLALLIAAAPIQLLPRPPLPPPAFVAPAPPPRAPRWPPAWLIVDPDRKPPRESHHGSVRVPGSRGCHGHARAR